MPQSPAVHDIYLEIGEKKVFACAVAWPGWCRSGKDAQTAVQALYDAAPRYASIARGAGLTFDLPGSTDALRIVERLAGSSGTEFGVPAALAPGDDDPVDAAELARLEALLQACWRAFDTAVQTAEGKELRKGPRGGGRDVPRMIDHVRESEAAYLKALGWKLAAVQDETIDQQQARLHSEILEGLRASAAGQIAATGPRGGKRWPPRYFVRRVAWHVLDHAWEIEDRIL